MGSPLATLLTRFVASIAIVCAVAFAAAQTPPGGTGFREPAWSPDGTHLAFVFLDRVWTMRPDDSQGRELTTVPGIEREPAWSPDGQQIAFAADRGDGFDIYVAPLGGDPQRVTTLAGDERNPSWTPGGRLVFAHREPLSGSQWDLYTIDLKRRGPGAEPRSLTQSAEQEIQPRVSPDGSRVAFVSDPFMSPGGSGFSTTIICGRAAAREARPAP